MKHLAHAIIVAAAILAAAYSTALATPAVTNFLGAHTADAAYVTTVAAIVSAAWRAYRAGASEPAKKP